MEVHGKIVWFYKVQFQTMNHNIIVSHELGDIKMIFFNSLFVLGERRFGNENE